MQTVGVTNLPPGTGFVITENFALAESDQAEPATAVMQVVDAGFFKALNIQALRGRVFSDTDSRTGASPVVVVNDSFARQHWTLDEAAGKQLRVVGDDSGAAMTVVGVVAAMKSSPFQAQAMPAVYLPTSLTSSGAIRSAWLVIRSTADLDSVTAWTRSVVSELDNRLPAPNLWSLDAVVASTFARQRLSSILLAMFASIALLLAAVGEYAVIQYVVRQRTSEIGIRIAVGARAAEVIRMVLLQGLALGAVGIVVGLGAAWSASRLIESMIYGIDRTDLFTYTATVGIFVAVAAVASLVPAWRAGRVDPIIALRHQ